MLSWLKQRLSRKLITILLGLLLISYLLSGWFMMNRLNDIFLNNLQHEGETLAHTVSAMSIEPMLSYDIVILNSHVNFVGKNNDQINNISIFDTEDKRVAEYKNTQHLASTAPLPEPDFNSSQGFSYRS